MTLPNVSTSTPFRLLSSTNPHTFQHSHNSHVPANGTPDVHDYPIPKSIEAHPPNICCRILPRHGHQLPPVGLTFAVLNLHTLPTISGQNELNVRTRDSCRRIDSRHITSTENFHIPQTLSLFRCSCLTLCISADCDCGHGINTRTRIRDEA